MSNLGFLFAYRRLRSYPELNVERAFITSDTTLTESLESGRSWRDFKVLAFSVSFEPDFIRIKRWAQKVGLPLSVTERAGAPALLCGGVGCQVNPRLLEGVADYLVSGRLEDGEEERALRAWLGGLTGHAVCGTVPPVDAVYSTIFTPASVFADTLLIEVQRGCPFACPFCWLGSRQTASVALPATSVLSIIDQQKAAPRVGLIAPCLTEYPELIELLTGILERGRGVGFASLRIERLTDKMLDLLVACGMKTLTGAPETGASRWKEAIGKKASTPYLIDRLTSAVARGVKKVRLYYLYGFPNEDHEDRMATIGEITEILMALKKTNPAVRMELNFNPLVPKPGTKWENTTTMEMRELRKLARKYREQLSQLTVKTNWGSVRGAQEQYRLDNYPANIISWPE